MIEYLANKTFDSTDDLFQYFQYVRSVCNKAFIRVRLRHAKVISKERYKTAKELTELLNITCSSHF